jgi:hypothetical protein
MQVKYRRYIDERVSAYVPVRLNIIELILTDRQTLLCLQDTQTYRTEIGSEGGIGEFVEHCLAVSYVLCRISWSFIDEEGSYGRVL